MTNDHRPPFSTFFTGDNVEGEFQFTDHHDRRIVGGERHKIAAADLALDREAEIFEEAFDGQIKRGFQISFPSQLSNSALQIGLASQLRCRPRDSVSDSSPNFVGGFDQRAGERLPCFAS